MNWSRTPDTRVGHSGAGGKGAHALARGVTLAVLFGLLLPACSAPDSRTDTPASDTAAADTATSEITADSAVAGVSGSVRTGAQQLAADGFRVLAGRRVGLIVNHTARVDTLHLIDLLHRAPDVELAAIFGPEHGYRGDANAGEVVADGRDARTGVPVYSLYGERRRPPPEALAGLDVLVFDIQDIGARFYTYIATMGLAMQAAAEAGVPFVVLDRPNPLGGDHVAGFVREAPFESFVGPYPIPVQHGLTVGELARMIRGEAFLPGLDGLELEVVPMAGWRRSMVWPDTGLPWVPTSPNIPDFETAVVYPGACFFEAVAMSEGRGTPEPFKTLGAAWADGPALVEVLQARGLPGVRFEAAAFTPRSIPEMTASPRFEDLPMQGIRYEVTDPVRFRPVETGIHVLHAFYGAAPDTARAGFVDRRWMGRLAGTDRLADLLAAGAPPEEIVAAWADEVAAFEAARAPYLLYE